MGLGTLMSFDGVTGVQHRRRVAMRVSRVVMSIGRSLVRLAAMTMGGPGSALRPFEIDIGDGLTCFEPFSTVAQLGDTPCRRRGTVGRHAGALGH